MPRFVRNFWIEIDCDGYKSPVALGPKKTSSGFAISIKIRENGKISSKRLFVDGTVTPDGTLDLDVMYDGKRLLHTYIQRSCLTASVAPKRAAPPPTACSVTFPPARRTAPAIPFEASWPP